MAAKTSVSLTSTAPSQIAVDALVVGVESEGPLSAPAQQLDAAIGGAILRLRDSGEFTAKIAETAPLYGAQGAAAPLILLVGLGKPAELTAGGAFRAASAAAKWLASKPRKSAAFFLAPNATSEVQESMIAGALVGAVGQDLYRAKANRHPLSEMLWGGVAQESLERGVIVGESCNRTRRLVNEPPNHLTPALLAQQAEQMAGECGIACEVWDEVRLAQERCGSLLAVAKGSAHPPRLVMLQYRGGAADQPMLGLVGKGVTFDSGGLSLKPTEGMTTMKCDMAGAATVLGALEAIARLKLPLNVTGFLGLVENMISGDCVKLGDVITARSGKTIEVLNTDAEGRLVLADVLDVARERGAARLVDLATLTGACMVALGVDVAGVMSNDSVWSAQVLSAAQAAGELAWPLPMFREYDEQIQSEIADLKNVGNGRWGGAITAAKFLEAFVGETPWVHVDIAGPAFSEKPKAWIDAGATGFFLRSLVQLCRSLAA